jgi:preprotein translocase subunit SecF
MIKRILKVKNIRHKKKFVTKKNLSQKFVTSHKNLSQKSSQKFVAKIHHKKSSQKSPQKKIVTKKILSQKKIRHKKNSLQNFVTKNSSQKINHKIILLLLLCPFLNLNTKIF